MTSTITIFPCTKGTSVSRHSHHPHQAEKSGSEQVIATNFRGTAELLVAEAVSFWPTDSNRF